ncbi:hypothetical protein ILYODFUR_038195 [Ilyodon furcidens]|uniref:Uncharacterized protein n=1 Tax=Ilyodon furcidens TaxID=33524 RepID=A0ABV0TQP2_9TELE
MLHYDKRTSPADLSTLQRNSSFTLRSFSTESTFAVNSTSVPSVSPGGFRSSSIGETRLLSLLCRILGNNFFSP